MTVMDCADPSIMVAKRTKPILAAGTCDDEQSTFTRDGKTFCETIAIPIDIIERSNRVCVSTGIGTPAR